MTLHALLRPGRRVLIAGNAPRLERMALRTVAAEPLQMRILSIVASGAVESLARGAHVELIRGSNSQPRPQGLERGCAVGIALGRARQGSGADLGELHVIHHNGPDVRGLMLDVTGRTLLDARVEHRRLPAEQPLGIRMACRAIGNGHADGRLVARSASVAKVGMPGRQRTGTHEPLGRRGCGLKMYYCERSGCYNSYDQRDPERGRFHCSHRRPK